MRNSYHKYIGVALLGVSLLTTSCNDYLDKKPDARMELSSPDDVSKLLVTAYSTSNPAQLLELYSDNTDELKNTSWTEFDRFQTQAFEWQDITETSDYESPNMIWSHGYETMLTANIALDFIEKQGNQNEYKAQKGEALLCRAFACFQMASVFCRAYDKTTADKDLGWPYPEHESNDLTEKYTRGTLAELYKKMEADILEALPLVENNYSQPKFHFTPSAAYAFAARFYLYYQQYDKAIEYATKVLGSNPTSMLRDWASMAALSPNGDVQPNKYIDTGENANLLLQTVYSYWGALCGPSYVGTRYAHGKLISQLETLQSKGPWGVSNNVFNYVVWYNDEISKYIFRKTPFLFEYTDLQAGIGYPHSEFAVFTTDQLLLERAEAYALSGQYDKAVADINLELKAFSKSGIQLSLESIQKYYSQIKYYTPKEPTPKKQFHTTFAIDKDTQEPLLQCLLHLKRIITLYDGERMQDIKRYGITIYRRTLENITQVKAVTDSLTVDDPRTAIQLPQEVISVGIEPNPRNAK